MSILDTADVAHLTGVKASTIRRWVTEGRLVRHQHGGKLAVDVTEVEHLRDTLKRGRPCREAESEQ